MNWVAHHVKPGHLVVDVGANAGSYTKHFVLAGATVIAIEPHPQMADQLRATYPGVTVIHGAATDHAGTVTYHVSRQSEHGSLYPANLLDPTGESVAVPAVRLDDVAPEADVVKIDAQGAEAAILRGASRLLARHRTCWYVEVWQQGLRAAGDSVAAVRQMFEAHGYIPEGPSWDDVQRDAERQTGHGSIDVVVIPQERAA